MDLASRFDAKVDRSQASPGGCWLWTASKTQKGYGYFKQAGRGHRAHRVAYELSYGPIPQGAFVCHRCDVPTCVNPAHLFAGTPQDNMTDKVSKGRQSRQLGESNGIAKLTESQVQEIRDRYTAGGITQRDLGLFYGVSQAHVSNIVRHESWQHA